MGGAKSVGDARRVGSAHLQREGETVAHGVMVDRWAEPTLQIFAGGVFTIPG